MAFLMLGQENLPRPCVNLFHYKSASNIGLILRANFGIKYQRKICWLLARFYYSFASSIPGSCVSQDLDAPQFSQPFYEITVEENIKIGLTLFSVTVTNKDPGEITFTLNDTTNFIITRRGDVEYYGGLDYEKPELREITLSITATDSGSPPKSTSIPLYINVTNINDESPKCAEPMYQGEVMNGAPAGTEVLQVVGVDKDVNTQLTYNLTVPNSYFEVNRLTGVITTSQVVDIAAILDGRFETFRVRVSDGLRNNLCPVMVSLTSLIFSSHFRNEQYFSSLGRWVGILI